MSNIEERLDDLERTLGLRSEDIQMSPKERMEKETRLRQMICEIGKEEEGIEFDAGVTLEEWLDWLHNQRKKGLKKSSPLFSL